MSGHCQVAGRKPGFGDAAFHSYRRTARRFGPNLASGRCRLVSGGRYVRLTVGARGVETVDRPGIGTVVARLDRASGPIQPLARTPEG
jgi:large subunit ribosomal protein L28